MPDRLIHVFLFSMCSLLVESRALSQELDQTRQCLVVLADSWTSTKAVMRCFERNNPERVWKEHENPIPVVVGRNGLGRGDGLINPPLNGAPAKREGDRRTPAGVFRLISAFGYATTESAAFVQLPYLSLSNRIEGIDDSQSRYYNKLVDRSKVKVDWRSAEKMRRDDLLYKWGIVVDHNPSRQPGAGSCIFLHVWKSSSSTTAGCTAMPENSIVRLLGWLDPISDPVLVQMPRAEYNAVQARYNLPRLDPRSSRGVTEDRSQRSTVFP